MTKRISIFNKQFNFALFFFFISALYGWLMRLHHVVSIPYFEYSRFIQAHSHVTFLGWGFLAVISVIGYLYFPDKMGTKRYKLLFYIMTGSLLGLLISFPLQGYKFFSILFLTVFLLASYVYLVKIYSDIKSDSAISARFIKTGIFYYFLSSLAIWMVGFVTVKFGKNDLYHQTIYFYLHFLYNGFFVFTLFGLLFRYFEKNNYTIKQNDVTNFYRYTNLAVIPAFALSLLWKEMPYSVIITGFAAVFLQLIATVYLYSIFKNFKNLNKSYIFKSITWVVFTSYFLKIVLQFLSAFPDITNIAVQNKSYFIIGYIHLFTLGFMSLFIFLLVYIHTGIQLSKKGLYLLLFGIIGSELLLFTQGVVFYFSKSHIDYYPKMLMLLSLFMPIGILLLLLKRLVIKKL